MSRATLLHPLSLLLGYADRVTERADEAARSAGLTVERVGRWRRCYRAPHINSHAGSAANPDITPTANVRKLISTRWSTATLTVSPAADRVRRQGAGVTGQPRCLDCAAVLYTNLATGDLVDQWEERICSASYRPHAADLPTVPVRSTGPAAPATSMPGRLWRAVLLAGAGAVPDPPLPHQAGCATSFPTGSAEKRCAGKHVAVRLDPGDPAGPVPGAPRAGAQPAPARLPSGPATSRGGAR